MDTTHKHSHTISYGGLHVHYWESNPQNQHTIVMLHGFRSSHQGLMKLAHEFPDHRMLIPDFPGYGQTDELTGENNLVSYADFIAGFISELKLDNVTLLGHSFGAVVGLAYAADHPESVLNLVLISPVPKTNIIYRAGNLYYLIGRALPSPLNKQWLTNRTLNQPVRNYIMRTNDPVIHSEIMREGERELDQLNPKINLENYFSLSNINPEIWLSKIARPILVVAGDSDRIARLSDIIHTYQSPQVTFEIIEGMGHFAPAEIPTEIAAKARAWLSTDPKIKRVNPPSEASQ